MNKKIIIALVVVIAGIFLWGFLFRADDTAEFVAAYQTYDAAARVHEASAHVPGGGNNAARQKLNELLPQVLAENLAAEERQKLSEEALLSVAKIRAEIDNIGREGEKADAALRKLHEASGNSGGFFTRQKMGSAVALAEDRARTIRDIQEISSEINRKLEDIFRGIITDGGELTTQRINALNRDLPEAEKQFDRLTENYRRLENIRQKLDTALIGIEGKS
ncbi:MAG: hypothetical protein HYT94_04380 [Parcubacteria group bacterium]|nr:hypothetical protein [Parcubacteria group bacterium]